jgi:hypothetical protein
MSEPIRVREWRGVWHLTLPAAHQQFRDFHAILPRDWLVYGYSDPMLKLWHRDARRRA